MSRPARRKVLRLGAAAAATVPLAGAAGVRDAHGASGVTGATACPRFPRAWFPITDYGAVGDGVSDCTAAIRAAVRACHAAGGGHVLVPPGDWATGAIHLRSGVDLHVTEGATVLFDTDPAAYLPLVLTRWQGVEAWNYSPLIYAYRQHDIAVTGRGVLDARGDTEHWWPWKGSGQYGWEPGMPSELADWGDLERWGAEGVPVADRVFGEGHYLRPSFLQPHSCRNVLVEGVTLRNSPFWNIHPVLSRDVTVRDVRIESQGPNSDGCNPDSCRNVTIRRVTFATHDDCIAIKSGRDQDGWRVGVPSRDILVEDCVYLSGGAAVAIGSEMSGGVRDVTARRLYLPRHPDLEEDSVGWVLNVKSTPTRGGYVRDVRVTDVDAPAWTYVPFEVTFQYAGGTGGEHFAEVSRLSAARWSLGGPCEYPVRVRARPAAPVRDVRLADLTFDDAAQDILLESVTGLRLHDVVVNGEPQEGPL
ncbi:glycoside hydrolase family 28 protein [Streptomyces johnsoniae]|uniref:Glycoside hydrolase family 28 protein n=1 Tax=Streptomyces johnsoniae TaxID=3075532 RepID=A0ABU2S6Y8_9ACTN|nr:glycoside hydrolase family 28 protein [Streptomyces sp. DSM 41886]MDT0444747.1 glycoside hydrolase family 28 protein [Streptomyces sp. DSM 41886]